MLVVIVQHHEVVSAGAERRLHQIEVNGGHLRADDGVVFPHFFGEQHTLIGTASDGPLFALLLPYLDGGEERTHTDSGSPQIVDLIDLQTGVDLVGAGQNIVHLVGGNGIQSAAEGV